MKALRFVIATALIAFTTSAFAGSSENEKCDACLAPEYASALLNDSSALADAGVSDMLQDMTQQVQQHVKEDGVNLLLMQMTRMAHDSVKSNNTSTAF
ncbi:MAG: hypothetical protein JST18_03000 [Bacteroidetes bacterium]|nr:hypothetical protein [Bacteroidota bacterium]